MDKMSFMIRRDYGSWLEEATWDAYLFVAIKHGLIDYRQLCKEAMTAFLKNSLDSNVYNRHMWRKGDVFQCWDGIQSDDPTLRTLVSEKLPAIWDDVRGPTLWKAANSNKLWRASTDMIWSFCLVAGCPEGDRDDPFKSLEILRE